MCANPTSISVVKFPLEIHCNHLRAENCFRLLTNRHFRGTIVLVICRSENSKISSPSGCGSVGRAGGLGPSGRTFESCHSDHMKMIRTFFSLESRSDYLYYLIIQISTVRNKYRYHSRLSMVSAFLCNRSLLDSIVIL